MLDVERGPAAPKRRTILDVVVDEKGGVQNSRAVANGSAASKEPPNAAQLAMHKTGRSPFPDRVGYSVSRS